MEIIDPEDIPGISNIPCTSFSNEDLLTFEPVSQEGYDILRTADPKQGLITWGINPCVAIAFYNPTHGIYLGHALGFNFFFRDEPSTATEPNSFPRNDTISEVNNEHLKLHTPITCKGASIKDSFPPWINEAGTICYMYAVSLPDDKSDSIVKRYLELRRVYHGTITPYIGNCQGVVLLKNGNFYGLAYDYSEMPQVLKDQGKEKDMALFRTQLSYALEKARADGKEVAEMLKAGTVKMEDFVNPDYTFKDTASNITNYSNLQHLTIYYGKKGLFFRTCLIDQQGGKRKIRRANYRKTHSSRVKRRSTRKRIRKYKY